MAQVNGEARAPTRTTDFNSAEYDPVEHLNAIFSHPSTLSAAPEVASALRLRRCELDDSIDALVDAQTSSNAASIRRLREAQAELADLFARIDGVRRRALETEQSITTMTADIKRLDHTKRNLTLSMTALKRLQMLTTAYEQLRSLGKSRQYRECGQLLGAVVQLMAHFKSYRSIDQIAALSRKVADVQRELLEQVCEDFELAWERHEVAQKRATLHEACTVIDALGDGARSRLVMWYCNVTLKEYRQIFRGNEEAGSLDNISRRYAWFNRVLKTYDAEQAQVFPAHWKVNESLANSFCENTKEDFKSILQRSARRVDGQTLDVNLLLSCLQETLDFEHSLDKRFALDPRQSLDNMSVASSDDASRPHAGFASAISSAFEPYLSLWVEAQDRHLASMIPKYRSQPINPITSDEEEFNPSAVLPSSTELFQFYRLTLAQCAKLSTGNRLLELSRVFSKYLDLYSQQILFGSLAASSAAAAAATSIHDTITILNTADYCAQTSSQLEEKIRSRIDADLAAQVDLGSQSDAFLGVAGACVRALVRRVELDCEPGWREMRNTSWSRLDGVGDQSAHVGVLVAALRARVAATLPLLAKQQYARAFCDGVVEAVTATHVASIAACRPVGEVGAEQLLLDSYVLRKALTELPSLGAAQQQQQASSSSSSSSSSIASAAYAKRTAATTARADALLKTLQVRPAPPEALVQAYLLHVGDKSEANFRKVLELKGLGSRREQAPLVELFNAHKAAAQHAGLPAAGGLLTQLNVGGGGGASVSSSSSSSLLASSGGVNPAAGTVAALTAAAPGGGIIAGAASGVGGGAGAAASSFGSALLSVAKEGASLGGSLGGSLAPSRVASPAAVQAQGAGGGTPQVYGGGQPIAAMLSGGEGDSGAAAAVTPAQGGSGGGGGVGGDLSANLRSIGRFFRRDLGGGGSSSS